MFPAQVKERRDLVKIFPAAHGSHSGAARPNGFKSPKALPGPRRYKGCGMLVPQQSAGRGTLPPEFRW